MDTLWLCQIAIENGPVEIVDLPMNSMVILHSYVTVYQRVIPSFSMPFDAESHFCSPARQQWSHWQHESGRVAPPVKRKLASEIREEKTRQALGLGS